MASIGTRLIATSPQAHRAKKPLMTRKRWCRDPWMRRAIMGSAYLTSSPQPNMAGPKKGLRSCGVREGQRAVPSTGLMGH
jgi:hypothetical protein